jgi:hypothetical protein
MIVQNPIGPRDAAPNDGPAGAPVANAKIEQAWLRELERAQWQQRPADARRGAPAPDAKGARAADGRTTPRAGTQAQSTEAWVASRATRAAAGAAAAAVPRAAAQDGPPAAGKPAQAAAAARDAHAAPARKPALAFEAEIAARLWGEPRRWDPRRVHARERGGRVWIWIRDAEFDASDTQGMTASLAQLARDAGLELEGITVNGHVVFGPAPGDDPDPTT